MSLFLIFLLCHAANPVPGFSVPLHPDHTTHLVSLKNMLLAEDSPEHPSQIHTLILSLLNYLSHEVVLSDWKDLLTLFLLSYHLRDTT